MPRYFFHLASAGDCVLDAQGIEKADLAVAHEHAIRIAYGIMRTLADPRDGEGWMITITNNEAGGDPELIVPFLTRYSGPVTIASDLRKPPPAPCVKEPDGTAEPGRFRRR